MASEKDVGRIYNLLIVAQKERTANHTELVQRVTALETTVSATPGQRTRPCEFFEDHVKEHKAAEKTIKDNITSSAFKIVVVAIISAATAFIVKIKG